MKSNRREMLIFGAAALPWALAGVSVAQGRGQGAGGRGGAGGNAQGNSAGRGGPPAHRGPNGNAGNAGNQVDQEWIQTLIQNRQQIQRQVMNLSNGVETLTETDNAQLRTVLVQHVYSMKSRVEEGRPIHLRDPLFRAVFQHAQQISMEIRETPRGVHVMETSDDPAVAKLIQQHAEVVNRFLKFGPAEVQTNHAVAT